MDVTISGVLTDQAGRVFLRQIAPATPGIISCSLESSVLPSETLADAFRQLTGLVVYPVRLTGLYFDATHPPGRLTIVYRCLQRGGAILSSEGSPVAGFFEPQAMPPGLTADTRRYLDDALHHQGGPPLMYRISAGLGARLGRIFAARPSSEPARVDWEAVARLIIAAGDGRVAWEWEPQGNVRRLPAATVMPDEAPWEAAAALAGRLWPKQAGRPTLKLAAIRIAKDRPSVDFIFFGKLDSNLNTSATTEAMAFLDFKDAGDDPDANDIRAIRQATADPEQVIVQFAP